VNRVEPSGRPARTDRRAPRGRTQAGSTAFRLAGQGLPPCPPAISPARGLPGESADGRGDRLVRRSAVLELLDGITVLQRDSDVVEPQEDLNLIKFDEDHTKDLLETYAQLVKKKR